MSHLTTPELITYICSTQDLEICLPYGVTHVILDHPALSIRSWVSPSNDDSLDSLQSLINHCRDTYPALKVSVNCDMLLEMKHQDMIKRLCQIFSESPVDFVRVQDLGLIQYFSEHSSIPVIYAAEMGNSNWVSLSTIANSVKRQVLALDLPYSDIHDMNKHPVGDLELQVQGPVLIQYSNRRFLAGLADEKASSERKEQIHYLAQDEDYPGRLFTFLDNPHGHFMYAYFDRCLLGYLQALWDCNLSGWIVDGRGESTEYLQACLGAYQAAIQAQGADIKDRYLTAIQAAATRPQKAGFFRANQTDRRRYKKVGVEETGNMQKVGRVLDIVKGHRLTIQCSSPIVLNDILHAKHPKITDCEILCSEMWTLDNTPVTEVVSGDLVQVPWVKGIQQQAVLYKLT